MKVELSTNYQAVYKAWRMFQKGKKSSEVIDMFAYYLEQNIEQLANDLTSRKYIHGGYQSVVVNEKKRRDLAVACVRDRVVHRLLYDYLVNIFDKRFDPDVWSCRKSKGLHGCLDRTQKLLDKNIASYVWRADIAKFFDNVEHKMLIKRIKGKVGNNTTATWLSEIVISSYDVLASKQASKQASKPFDWAQGKHGIPIGNLTSQIFANIYLNEFDRFVRHQLKPQAYVRYGDDFLLFCETRKHARELRFQAETFLVDELGLSLNSKNDIIVRSSDGLKFLGHDITRDKAIVDKHTSERVPDKLNIQNVASYKALYLDDSTKEQIDWILLQKVFDEMDIL